MMRKCYPILFSLFTFLFISVLTRAQTLNTCNAAGCEDIFNSSRVRITAIRSLSTYAYFQNPLLEADIEIDGGNTGGIQLYMSAPKRLYPDTNEHCELLLVGLANAEDELQTTIMINANETTARIKIYAFCQNINLPGVEAPFPDFPKQSVTINVNNIENMGADEEQHLITLVQKATSGACFGGSWVNTVDANITPEPFPLTLDTLATQFAVFILFADENQRDNIWRAFLLEANNRIYQRDFEGIYCLLSSLTIAAPIPTETPTPTLTPTPVFEPSATPTTVPLWDQPIVAVPIYQRTISPLRFLLFAGGGIIASVVCLALLAIKRFRLFVLVLLSVIFIGSLLFWFGENIINNVLSIFGGIS